MLVIKLVDLFYFWVIDWVADDWEEEVDDWIIYFCSTFVSFVAMFVYVYHIIVLVYVR